MRATRIVGHPSLTLPSASSHPTPSSPHALRNTLFVVVVSTLKSVPISTQYLLISTDANAFRGHRLTTQKWYAYAAYKTRNGYLPHRGGIPIFTPPPGSRVRRLGWSQYMHECVGALQDYHGVYHAAQTVLSTCCYGRWGTAESPHR